MSKRDDGGPAFPSHGSMGEVTHEGLSLRDWLAGQVINGLCAGMDNEPLRIEPNQTMDQAVRRFWKGPAEIAYLVADALIAERNKPESAP